MENRKKVRINILLLFLVPMVLTASSCGVKVGEYWFDQKQYNERFSKFTERLSMEYELYSPKYAKSKMDTSLAVGMLASITDDGKGQSQEDRWKGDEQYYFFRHCDLTTHFYPMGVRRITPVVGAGIGWYDYFLGKSRIQWNINDDDFGWAEMFLWLIASIADIITVDKDYTIESGFRPHITVGMHIVLLKGDDGILSVFLDYRHSFHDFSMKSIQPTGNQISIGVVLIPIGSFDLNR